MLQFLPIIGAIIDKVLNVIDKSVEDKDLKEKLKTEIQLTVFTKEYDVIMKQLQAQRDIIVAEAAGHSWLQRNWRPIIMLMFGYMIAHNFILAPFFGFQKLDIPPDVYQIIKVGLGGYCVGRTVEKVVAIKKGGGV